MPDAVRPHLFPNQRRRWLHVSAAGDRSGDQRAKPYDPNQGWGVFGRFGIVYDLLNFRDDLPALVLPANAEQGVEPYCNIEVTPWLHSSPDLQRIVNPGGDVGDCIPAIVCGARAQVSP